MWYTTIVGRVHLRYGGKRVHTHKVVCQLPPRFGDPVAPEGHAERCMYEVLHRSFHVHLEDGMPLRFGPEKPISAASEDTRDGAALKVQNLLQLVDSDGSDDDGDNADEEPLVPNPSVDVGQAIILEEFDNLLKVDDNAAAAILNSLRSKYELSRQSSEAMVSGKRSAASSGIQECIDRAQKRAKTSGGPACCLAMIPALLHDNGTLCELRTSCKERCLSMAHVWNYRYLQQYLKSGRSVTEQATPRMLACLKAIDEFGDSVIRDIQTAFAHFESGGKSTGAHRADVNYGVSLVECIMIRRGRGRMEAGGEFEQLYMDSSCDMAAQLHKLICDVLTRSNLPDAVRRVCCAFLEYETSLLIPASTWQILRRLFDEGTFAIKGDILRIARGNDAIPDDAIVRTLMLMTDMSYMGERIFVSIMQYYIMESHAMLVEFLRPWMAGRTDLLTRSNAFRRFVMHMRARD